MFTQQLARYSQENVDCTFDSVSGSPEKVVTLIDKAAQVSVKGTGKVWRSALCGPVD